MKSGEGGGAKACFPAPVMAAVIGTVGRIHPVSALARNQNTWKSRFRSPRPDTWSQETLFKLLGCLARPYQSMIDTFALYPPS